MYFSCISSGMNSSGNINLNPSLFPDNENIFQYYECFYSVDCVLLFNGLSPAGVSSLSALF